jgi:cytochrome c553
MRPFLPGLTGFFAVVLPVFSQAAEISASGREFFESKIRPVLASACYDCHGAEKQKAGLRLDSRRGLLEGGDSGPAIAPGDPEKSLLFQAIAGTHAELKMPKNADPLGAPAVASFREWIEMGAPDPRDEPSAGGDIDWAAAFALRRQAWFWQPLREEAPPDVPGVAHPVDRFLRAAQRDAGLSPAPRADDATIARRLAFVLTGLPPAPPVPGEPMPSPEARADRLLASPAFGERWARHWMDWLRYADSHGSEGDPAIPHAWQYRDFLVRALNADVPYFQLVREHLAGDLIPPRLSPDGTLNESALGPAHLRMVFHGFTPTDALDEFVTFTDNQVDVVSKAFLGLTVSCARCHNHKFDAISQADYTALFGVFANTRPATIDVRAPGVDAASRQRLAELKQEITRAVKEDWQRSWESFPQRLAAWQPKDDAEREEAVGGGHGPLAAWLALRDVPPDQFAEKWEAVAQAGHDWVKSSDAWIAEARSAERAWWNGRDGNLTWTNSGAGVQSSAEHGEFLLLPEGDAVLAGVLDSGFSSARQVPGDRAVVASSRFTADGGKVWLRVAGQASIARLVVQNYPRSGLIYPKTGLNSPRPQWISFDLDYWKGEAVHLEVTTAADAPIETGPGDRSAFSLLEVAYPSRSDLTPPAPGVPLQRFTTANPRNREELLAEYQKVVAAQAPGGQAPADRAEFLNFFLRAGLVPNTLKELPTAAPLVEEYRRLAAQLPGPVRAPGVMEGGPGDWPLYARGDHKKPGVPVPRRFLSALDATPYETRESGRRELADSIAGPGSALASRVLVNRLWHHVFGRGLVATPDNFGKLGEPPTHPELLDWLAREFQNSGGSLKSLLRLLVTSDAFQARSAPSAEAAAKDPENKLLTHWTLRRLEAEAIRDAMLTMTGGIEQSGSGPGVGGDSPRRSLYVSVIRNALDPFLSVFDAPVPSSTRGKRDATNIPAQALTLMNAPRVQSWAKEWAARVSAAAPEDTERIRRLYREGFQREPSPEEVAQSLAWMAETAAAALDLEADRARKKGEVAALETERAALTAPVIAALKSGQSAPAQVPSALAEWDFEDGSGSTLPLTLHGGAKIFDGALHLNGRDAWASSGALGTTLKARTLEAWVTLANLDQVGGGVFTLQDLQGDTFDAIVFAENGPRQWLAGSNSFARTDHAPRPKETDAVTRPVHVAITWSDDGTIRLFRDGAPYGQPYQSNGPVTFRAGESVVQFGCRHGQPSGNRLLAGAIHRARLYDRALTPDEVARTAALEGHVITRDAVLALLPEAERRRFDVLTHQIAALEAALATDPAEPMSPLHSLALALLNTKEFIYLR